MHIIALVVLIVSWLVLILCAVPTAVLADTCYVRDGGTATGSSGCAASGGNWNIANAYDQMPTTIRGNTYLVAAGTYNGFTLNTANSGTTLITIKKATVASHGTSTGWLDSYAATRANFGQVLTYTDYVLIDGVTRNESNWNDGAAYGFHFNSFRTNPPTNVGKHYTIQYVDAGGTDGAICHYLPSASCDAGVETAESFYITGFDSNPATDWIVSHFRSHNVKLPFQMAGAHDVLIEYGWIGPNWSKQAIRGGNQNQGYNITIRYNKIVDGCRGDPLDGTARACTAHIAIWDTTTAGWLDNNNIYGNVILETHPFPDEQTDGLQHSNGCIRIGGGDAFAGVVANNSHIYNNTIAGQDGSASIHDCAVSISSAGTGNLSANNIWYVTGNVTTGCGGTCANNTAYTDATQFVNPVVSYPGTGFDYHLAKATVAGTTLSAPYNQDMDGVTRGSDGTWDRGAYEFGSGDVMPPAAPTGVTIQ